MSANQDNELTRKDRRERARAERKQLEQAAASEAARRKRLIQLGSVLGGVVVIIAVILIATSGGGSDTKTAVTPQSQQGNQEATAVDALLSEIPQRETTLGDPRAPATLVYFGDLECPYCREFTVSVLPTLINNYVRAGKLKITYKSLNTATHEPSVFTSQQVAAYAAGKQGHAWNYIELFYHEQGEEGSEYVTESFLQGLAQQIPGLNLQKWTSDRSDQALSKQVEADIEDAGNNGLSGTPSFLLGKTDGTLQRYEASSVTDPQPFEEAINRLV